MRPMCMIGAAAFAVGLATAARAQAVIDITQSGSDVLMTLSGSLNTAGLTYIGIFDANSNGILPDDDEIFFTGGGGIADAYEGFSGPASFGSRGP